MQCEKNILTSVLTDEMRGMAKPWGIIMTSPVSVDSARNSLLMVPGADNTPPPDEISSWVNVLLAGGDNLTFWAGVSVGIRWCIIKLQWKTCRGDYCPLIVIF